MACAMAVHELVAGESSSRSATTCEEKETGALALTRGSDEARRVGGRPLPGWPYEVPKGQSGAAGIAWFGANETGFENEQQLTTRAGILVGRRHATTVPPPQHWWAVDTPLPPPGSSNVWPKCVACAQVGKAKGQNFHSMSYREQGGKHLIFISAQVDNAIGTVEIVDPRIITRLKTDDQLPGSTRSVSGWTGFSSCGDATCPSTAKQLAHIIAHKDTIDTVFVRVGGLVTKGGAHLPGMDGNTNHSVCYSNGSGVPIADTSHTFPWAAFRFGTERCNLPPLDGDGSGRYLCTPFPDALVTAWASPLSAAGVAVMPVISGWPGSCNVSDPAAWPLAGRDDGWFAAAVMIAKKFGFAGWALDVEPTVTPPGSGVAYFAEYVQFLETFSARLAAPGQAALALDGGLSRSADLV